MSLLTPAGYAEYRGCSCPVVINAIKSGKLVRAVSLRRAGTKTFSLIDPKIADIEWPPSTKELAHKKKKSRRKKNPDDEEIEAPASPHVEPELSPFMKARTEREQAQTKLAQMKLEEATGRLVDADEVAKAWTNIAGHIRTKVMSLPVKARQKIPDLSPTQFAHLEKISRELLEELSNDIASEETPTTKEKGTA